MTNVFWMHLHCAFYNILFEGYLFVCLEVCIKTCYSCQMKEFRRFETQTNGFISFRPFNSWRLQYYHTVCHMNCTICMKIYSTCGAGFYIICLIDSNVLLDKLPRSFTLYLKCVHFACKQDVILFFIQIIMHKISQFINWTLIVITLMKH